MKRFIHRLLGDHWYTVEEDSKWGIYHCRRGHIWSYPYDTKEEAQSQCNFLNKLV